MSPTLLGTSPLAAVVEVVLVLVVLALGVHFIGALMRDSPWVARRKGDDDLVCARCGYDLRGLELPRCPECGTLRGFTVPLAALGLSEPEIREGFARMRAHRGSRGANSAARSSVCPGADAEDHLGPPAARNQSAD